MPDPVSVRAYQDSDLEPLMKLWADCYGESAVNRELWLRRHFGLPGLEQGTMVAESADGLVGMQPMECYPFHLDGERVLVGVMTGVMVHPAHRRRGLFTRLVAACEARAWDAGAILVTTMPNERSRPGFLKAGYEDPGERRLLMLPLRPVRLARRRLSRAGVLAAAPAALGGRILKWRRARAARGAFVAEVASFDTRVAQVAESAARGWSGLFQDRSDAWLNWRYPAGASSGYLRFVASDGGTNPDPRAFAVTARETREGLQTGYLVDFAGVDQAAVMAAISAAVDRLDKDGLDLVLAVVSSASQQRTLRRVGFLPVPRWIAPKRFFTVYRPRPGEKRVRLQYLRNIDRWYQTLGDWDTI